ncbi:ATP-binding protein [Candidatus Enterococcus clewellii]|uniref:Schlafen AlbA-2 domain-containing protein n=1 Tax=Candidatus Enterococcus clewellii TaxID=1834193 RepID=A0AAQ3Y0E2_9ENTE
MNTEDLSIEILELIELGTEGDYWDFKQQWYSKNIDLLHDIICMANSPANRDAYIIIGVKDETNEIAGVRNDEKRKNQQQVIDLIRKKPKWAGGNIPEIYVKTVSIFDENVDVIIIKQSDNTPFYLLEDYKYKEQGILYKGNIYTRKGDTNTPKTDTANLYDTEILWKRRFGLLYNPSQRAKNYLIDLENWERVDGESDKSGITRFFFYYKQNPDYTVHFTNTEIEEDEEFTPPKDINDESLGDPFYYLYAFCNTSCHTDFHSDEKATLYYRDVPLFSSLIESIDKGRTKVIPPEFWIKPYFIKSSFRYLLFEFVISYWSGNYSNEAKQMFLRVIPLFKDDTECAEFMQFVEERGFTENRLLRQSMHGEALKRFDNTIVEKYELYGDPSGTEYISSKLRDNPELVVNFSSPTNPNFDEITRKLKIGKMLVDWLDEWRNFKE